MTEMRRPCFCNCGIARVSKVVLPAPLHPARPITFITFSGDGVSIAVIWPEASRVPGIHALTLSPKKDVDGRDKPGHDGQTVTC